MSACAACGQENLDGFRFCGGCGAPLASGRGAGQERKLATILFADLVGSTELGASQDPERTRALLERFYGAMAAEIERAGGTLEKFVGDAVLASFGAPAAQEDHAERALHGALSMQRRLRDVFGDALALRIGVNTGEVVVGAPREGSSFVTGDAVNVAARLEQAAAPGEILVGERTVSAARGAFEFGDPTVVEAKGKPAGVSCCRLVRALSLMRPRGVGGLRRTFVGRDSELEVLRATYRRVAAQGEPHVVTIMGEAGVGKTRLVRELSDGLAGEAPALLRRTGRCLPYGQGITYWPLGEVIKEHLGILESDTPDAVRQKLGSRALLGLALGLDAAPDLHPLDARERLHEAWIDFVAKLAADQPAVVLIEDLHWAEPELLDLLERSVRDVRASVLLLGTARPELLDRRPAWGGGRRNTSLLWLEPLSEEDAGRMVDGLLAAELPEPVRKVLERAEGNPFFVEELVRTLVDQGVLRQTPTGWAADKLPGELALPDSVQAVVAARVDLLRPAEKAALQAASVMGRVFWAGPVLELAADGEPDFAVLEDRDLIRRHSDSSMVDETEYAIKHALTREVAYGSLSSTRRAKLHAAFAGWLERVGGGRDEWAAQVAHHYAEAVRPEEVDLAWADQDAELADLRERAIASLTKAAELATRRYELDEALAMLDRALALEETRVGLVALWSAIGRANALKFDGKAFWTAMQNAIELEDDPGRRADLVSRLALDTAFRSGMWRRMPDPAVVDGWIETALALAPAESVARARALIARAMWNPSGTGDAAREGSALAERLGDAELRSHAWDARGIHAFATGEYDLGRAWAERRFELLDEISDPDHRADIYMAPISGCVWGGHFKEARRLARMHDEIAGKLTPHHRLHAVSVLVEVEELLGVWEAVRALGPRLEETVAANVDTPCIRNARSLLVYAAASEYLGDGAEARRIEQAAESVALEGYGPVLDMPRARLALERGDLEAVERLLVQPPLSRGWYRGWMAIATLVVRLDSLVALGEAAKVEAEAQPLLRPNTYLEPFGLRALGLVRQDRDLIERALQRFEAFGLDWHGDRTRRLLAG